MKTTEPKSTTSTALQRNSNAAPFFQPEESREGFFGSAEHQTPFFNPVPPAGSNQATTTIQAKLTIGAQDGVYEQETDATAHKKEDNLTDQELIPSITPTSSSKLQRKVPAHAQASDGIFAIESTAASTIQIGSEATYNVKQLSPTFIAGGSSYHYQWSLQNDPVTFPEAVKKNPSLQQFITGPKDKLSWKLYAHFPGTHLIKSDVLLDNKVSSSLAYEQTVTASGASPDFIDLVVKASQTKVHPGVKEWGNADILAWKSPVWGDPDYIHKFKAQWVRGYRDVIRAAAAEYKLPELLVAGVAYSEVGGDPSWIDDIALGVRRFDHLLDPTLEPLTITEVPQKTSFGNVSIQIRRAAETLGLEPEKITTQQEDLIIAALKEPRTNIFIAAKHLSELRDIDFMGKGAADMTYDEIKVTATRYNRGSEISLENIKKNMSYGESIIKRAETLIALLSD